MTITYTNKTIGIDDLVLPDAPDSSTYRIGGKELTHEQFIEWFNNPGDDEFLLKTTKEGKNGESPKTVYELLATRLSDAANHRFKPIKFNNVDYYYDYTEKVYRRDEGIIRAWIFNVLRNAQHDDRLPVTYNPDRDVNSISRLVNLYHVLEGDDSPFNNYDGFAVNNCVIVFRPDGTFDVKPITSSMMFNRKAQVNYSNDRVQEKTEKAETILKQWLPEIIDGVPQWEWLVQIMAQAILQSLPKRDHFKCSYILLGEADSGKTTAGDLNGMLFGQNNVSSKKIQQFGSKFDMGELVGKFVNYGDDITTVKLADNIAFKEIVGHRWQRVEEKFGKPYNGQITAAHVYSANALPGVDKSIWNDEAWWKRWNIIKFNGHFKKDPSWVKNNIDSDFLEGLLILAIAEACAIIKRGNTLKLEQPWNIVQDMWIGGESKFHEFFSESFCECPGNIIHRQVVVDSLKEWFDKYMTIPENVSTWPRDEIDDWKNTQWKLLPNTIPAITTAMKREGVSIKQLSSAHSYDGVSRPYVFKDIAFRQDVRWEVRPTYITPDTHLTEVNGVGR